MIHPLHCLASGLREGMLGEQRPTLSPCGEGLSFQLGAGRGEYLGWQFLHSFWDCQASGKHDTGDAIQLGGDHRAAVSASKYFMAP